MAFTVADCVHVLFEVAAVATGAVAMLSSKRRGRHSNWGAIYFWCLVGVVATMSALSFMRWQRTTTCSFLGAFIRVRVFRAHRCPAALAPMAQAASQGMGTSPRRLPSPPWHAPLPLFRHNGRGPAALARHRRLRDPYPRQTSFPMWFVYRGSQRATIQGRRRCPRW